MIFLTFVLYVKNRLDAGRAYKLKEIDPLYFKTYTGNSPSYLEASRQTLKNQFELPVIFYFLTILIYSLDNISIFEILVCWCFSISRYVHAYIRLSSNYVPYRAKIFTFGFIMIFILFLSALSKSIFL